MAGLEQLLGQEVADLAAADYDDVHASSAPLAAARRADRFVRVVVMVVVAFDVAHAARARIGVESR